MMVEDVNEMKMHEGECRFCGQKQEIMAAHQEEADEIATLNCNCSGSEEYRRKQDLAELINETCELVSPETGFVKMSDEQLEVLHQIAAMLASGIISKVTLDIADSRCVMSEHKDGSFTFKRNKVLQLGGDI